MRKWVPVILIVVAIAFYILANAGSSIALSDIAARPVQALARDTSQIAVQQTDQTATADQASIIGGEGVLFGYRFHYQLPEGEPVTCTIRFRTLACANGWTAIRPD